MNKKGRLIDLLNLADMLRELDLVKNSTEQIEEVLIYIANEIERYVEKAGENDG